MLFLVISTPVPTRPSEVREQRKEYWHWIQNKLDSGIARSVFPRTGLGAVAVFDVSSHEILHMLLNEWADLIPAEFAIYPLMEPESIKTFLDDSPSG